MNEITTFQVAAEVPIADHITAAEQSNEAPQPNPDAEQGEPFLTKEEATLALGAAGMIALMASPDLRNLASDGFEAVFTHAGMALDKIIPGGLPESGHSLIERINGGYG